MYAMKMKNWFHHEHISDLHQVTAYFDKMIHNSMFWMAVAMMFMIAFLLLLIVFAMISNGGNTNMDTFYFGGQFPYPIP